jgi:hypothetical protein
MKEDQKEIPLGYSPSHVAEKIGQNTGRLKLYSDLKTKWKQRD